MTAVLHTYKASGPVMTANQTPWSWMRPCLRQCCKLACRM